MSKDGRGRKEHELKKICRERTEVREALFELAASMKRMTDLVSHIVSNGIKVNTEVVEVKTISVPTLTSILSEHGHTRQKGRPKGIGSTSWINNPQAIKAVADVLKDHGLHKGREKLLAEGIDYKNENGESEHCSFIDDDGKKILSITTLKEIAKVNGITFAVGPKSSSSSVIENRHDEDDEEDEDEEDDEDVDEDDDEDEDSEDEDDEESLDDEDAETDDEEFDDDEDFDDEIEDFDDEEEEDDE
jgi:hypothetical protein